MIQTVLVLCVGNICRSPIAERLLAEHLKIKSPQTSVHSAGLAALVGKPADPMAQELMLEKGFDISNHRGKQVSSEMLLQADIIFTMSDGQRQEVECNLPSIRGRVQRLGQWGGYDIPDPYRRPKEAFQQALLLIEQGVQDWCLKLWN